MEIYLLRHAIAAERGSGRWKSDSERPLTEEGIEKMKEAARGLAAAGIAFDRIFSSPYVRARETALIVARTQRGGIEVEELDELASGLDPADLFRVLARSSLGERVLLVGHEPDFGLLAARLLALPAARALPFRKGGIARIDVDGMPPKSPGTLIWMLTPRLARSLAG